MAPPQSNPDEPEDADQPDHGGSGKRPQGKPKRATPVPMPDVREVQVPLTPKMEAFLAEGSRRTGMFMDEVASMHLEFRKGFLGKSRRKIQGQPLAPKPAAGAPDPPQPKRLRVPMTNVCWDRFLNFCTKSTREAIRQAALKRTIRDQLEQPACDSLASVILAFKALYLDRKHSGPAAQDVQDRLKRKPRLTSEGA